MKAMLEIGGRKIGMGYPPIISCDLALNHGADLDIALKMIDVAAECGADGVKVQYFKASDFSEPGKKTITYKQWDKTKIENYRVQLSNYRCNHPERWLEFSECYQGKIEDEYKFFHRHEINLDFVKACHKQAKKHGLVFGVTTTSAEGVKQVVAMTDYFKIASDMAENAEMITEMYEYNRPLIISTGHMNLETVAGWRPDAGIFLHCVSEYPAKNPQLWKLTHMREMGYLVGFSDHTQGIDAAVRATELGAVWLEIHYTLDHTMSGEGHWYSKDPAQLRQLVEAIK